MLSNDKSASVVLRHTFNAEALNSIVNLPKEFEIGIQGFVDSRGLNKDLNKHPDTVISTIKFQKHHSK